MFVQGRQRVGNLTSRAADSDRVGSRFVDYFFFVLRAASLAVCLVVLLSFLYFATGQGHVGTAHETTLLGSANATAQTTTVSTSSTVQANSLHGRIDSASDTLTSPFRSVVNSGNQWVVEGVETLLALLIYGVGVAMLIRYVRMRDL